MLRKIPISALKPGMFLVRFGEGTFASPRIDANRMVEDEQDIQALLADNIAHVWIDDAKGLSSGEPLPEAEAGEDDFEPHPAEAEAAEAAFESVKRKISFFEEIGVARRIYTRALEYAAETFDKVRRGEDFNFARSEAVVEDIMATLYRNDKAITGLANLRRKSEYLHTHSVNVCVLCALYGKYLGLPESKVRSLALAGLFHDLGMCKVDGRILAKPGKLTPMEYAQIKRHPVESYVLLQHKHGVPPLVLRCVIEHHERFDGSGYPRGLPGDKISTYTRILSIADVYDAMTSERCYSPARLPTEALRFLYKSKDKEFFPAFVEQFIRCMGIYPVGCLVRLSDGRSGVVTDVSPTQPLHPTVKVVFDRKMRPVRPEFVDLSSVSRSMREGLVITDCLDPKDYRIELDMFLK